MAKRAASDEKPFRPLDASVLQSVMRHTPSAPQAQTLNVTQPASPPAAVAVVELSVPAARPAEPSPSPDWQRAVVRPVEPVVPKFDQEKRVLFTREESRAFERLVQNLALRVNTQVKASHVFRALATMLLRAETYIDQRAGEKGTLSRPPNGDYAALQRFEREIASILAHALRDAGHPS